MEQGRHYLPTKAGHDHLSALYLPILENIIEKIKKSSNTLLKISWALHLEEPKVDSCNFCL